MIMEQLCLNINNQGLKLMKSESSKKSLWQEFEKQQEIKRKWVGKLSPLLQAQLDATSSIIYSQFGKSYPGTMRGQKKPDKNLVTHEYRDAFRTLSRQQKVEYYCRQIVWIRLKINEKEGKQSEGDKEAVKKLQQVCKKLEGIYTTDIYSRSFSIGIWKHKKMRVDRENGIIYAEKDQKIKTYVMKDYLLRKSKNKDYFSFVLEARNNHTHQKSRTVHLGFKEERKFQDCLKQLTAIYMKIEYQLISNYFSHVEKHSKPLSFSCTFTPKKMSSSTKKQQDEQSDRLNQTVQLQIKSDLFASYPFQDDSEFLSKSMTMEDERQENVMQQNTNPADFAYTSLETVTNQQIFEQDRSLDHSQKQLATEFQGMYSPRNKDGYKFRQNIQTGSSFKKIKSHKVEDEPPLLKRQLSRRKSQKENHKINNKKTIIESIASLDQQLIEAITDRQDLEQLKKKTFQDNIFHKLVPNYDLSSIEETVNYGTLLNEGDLKVFGHVQKSQKIKIFYQFPQGISQKEVLGTLIDQDLFKQCISEVQEINLKTLIKSQNSAMMYMKIKPYNRLYRARDFVFLRHVFKNPQGTSFMIDKSIENINYPPFTTIVRGNLMILWGVKKTENGCKLIADIQINNQGYLNPTQNLNLSIKFIKCLSNIKETINSNRNKLMYFDVFHDDWVIKTPQYQKNEQIALKIQEEQKNVSRQTQIKIQQNKNGLEIVQKDKEEVKQSPFVAILKQQNQEENEKGELDEKQVQKMEEQRKLTSEKIHRDLDEKGHVIITQEFARKRHILAPLPKQPQQKIKYLERIDGFHPIWKKQWVRDQEQGSLLFIDQKKINDQKGVLKFIISQIGKNIFSGKSVMNISLPVDIFLPASNLEIMASSFSYSSVFLEPAAKTSDSIQKLKNITAFGLNNSPLYLRIQKPFNPILGETFQSWIDGCPIYAQQISHHPPIGAFYMVGRGYRLSAQLQSKIQLHVNSGCGINYGIFKVQFDDGTECCYTTPSGQLCGLTFGARKFNIVGKSYYWLKSKQQCLFLELSFNPSGKGFFSIGKQAQPIDYFEGYIYEVKSEFIQNFQKKRKSLTEKDIIKKHGKIHGIWNMFMNYDDEQIYDLDTDFPLLMEYEEDPLPSDSNWREDIQYRRIGQTSRAQSEKERLEVFQRNDRKLREKMSKKK